MDKYWYISTNHNYPRPSKHVNQVTLYRSHSLIEMSAEATESDFEVCNLIYIGRGQLSDNHIQSNINKYKRGVNL